MTCAKYICDMVKESRKKTKKSIKKEKLTAGNAKNDMANTLKHDATILPSQV